MSPSDEDAGCGAGARDGRLGAAVAVTAPSLAKSVAPGQPMLLAPSIDSRMMSAWPEC